MAVLNSRKLPSLPADTSSQLIPSALSLMDTCVVPP
jgi:hypothetical protein